MKVAWVVAAVVLALALQTTLARFVLRGAVAVDLVLVVVVYVALTLGPVPGLLSGAVAGLAQDALGATALHSLEVIRSGTVATLARDAAATGVIGVGGLAKTVVGFLAGVVGMQFIVTQWLPRLVVFLGATIIHAVLFMGLYVIIGLRPFSPPYGAVAGQAVGNALVGVVAFQVVELLPGALERRKARRMRLRR